MERRARISSFSALCGRLTVDPARRQTPMRLADGREDRLLWTHEKLHFSRKRWVHLIPGQGSHQRVNGSPSMRWPSMKRARNPLYRQLEVQLRSAILEGRLQLGERLPSTRRLADELGVARNTTVNAYKQLIVEGYVVTARGWGRRIARDLPEHLLAVRARRAVGPAKSSPLPLSRAARRISAFQPWIEGKIDRPSRPFQPHTPAIDALTGSCGHNS